MSDVDYESISITTEEETEIKNKSPDKMPLNPTAQGWTGSAIRKFLGSSITGSEGSVLSLLKTKLQKTKEAMEAVHGNTQAVQAMIDELREQFNVSKFLVKPVEGLSIAKGEFVMYDSADSEVDVVRVRKANLTGEDEKGKWKILGAAVEDIAEETLGVVKNWGEITNIDTSHLTHGEVFYLDNGNSGGVLSEADLTLRPYVPLGICLRSHASEGMLLIKNDSSSTSGGTKIYVQAEEPVVVDETDVLWIKIEE